MLRPKWWSLALVILVLWVAAPGMPEPSLIRKEKSAQGFCTFITTPAIFWMPPCRDWLGHDKYSVDHLNPPPYALEASSRGRGKESWADKLRQQKCIFKSRLAMVCMPSPLLMTCYHMFKVMGNVPNGVTASNKKKPSGSDTYPLCPKKVLFEFC